MEDDKGVLVEVTMLKGVQQTKMEIWPIARHLKEFSEKHGLGVENSLCYFVAPSIFIDSERQAEFVGKDKLYIYPKSIKEFIEFLETSKKLYC